MFRDIYSIVEVNKLDISNSDILKYLGNNDITNKWFLDIAKTELKKNGTGVVKIGVQFFNVSLINEQLHVSDIVLNVGKEFSRYLKTCQQIAIYACTLDDKLINQLNKYNAADQAELAFITDVLGSVLVEKASEYLLDLITKEAETISLKTTNTLSPGNCGWDIIEQHKLFSLLSEKFLGIKINKEGMMNPVKSVNGIIGIGNNVKFHYTDCSLCNSLNCVYRKK